MKNQIGTPFEPRLSRVHPESLPKGALKWLGIRGALIGCLLGLTGPVVAADSFTLGTIRIQCLSSSLVRLEVMGPNGFEDRETFHIVNRAWPGTTATRSQVSNEVLITTPNYIVHVPVGATGLPGIYVASPEGKVIFQASSQLSNSVWLPGPADSTPAWAFADTPRLVPSAWGLTPAPVGAANAATSGWDTNNDAADVYVFIPEGGYKQLRSDFLKLTGPTEMIPLYALGSWDSRWYDYSESTALDQIEAYRSRFIPLDVLVCDTGWRVNASTGYQPNSNLFPDMARFFSEAHAANVRVMFNDHPEPVGASALDPAEVMYRYTNLAQLTGQGLDVWWYDRNWSVSLFSPSPNLRKEVWGMRIYQDEVARTNASSRPLIMANVDGIDNGIRNRPPNVAAHRYSIQWTGDIGPSMTYLRYAVQNAVHAGVQALFPYQGDDLGGHTSDPGPEGYIRWIEYGALSPIYRPHCTYNLTRMPWTFGPEAEWIARRMINLRYRLLPVLYAGARENYDTGEPILRRLDLDYPQYPEAASESQYLIGHSLLVAPMVDDGSTVVSASWLTTTNGQPGLNAAYFSNTNLSGAPTLTRIDSNIDFDWNGGSPGGAVPSQNFTVRWTGNVTIPPGAGDVTLAALSDDGVRVWVDGQLCLDNWGPNDSVTTESTNTLRAGQTYPLRVEYLQLGGKDLITLKWRDASPARMVWVPPGKWINAWTGAVVTGPAAVSVAAPLGKIPLFIRSGSIFALAPSMQYTGQRPWDPVTLDVYPSTTETDQTTLYEDDTQSTAYKQGQSRTTTIHTWADDAAKTISVSIASAVGNFAGALTERAWVARLHRPPNWPEDLAPAQVTLNGQLIGPVVRRVKNTTAMPLGADNGAPDADVFEVALPRSSVLASNLLVATFASASSPWTCGDIGYVGAEGKVIEGASMLSNAVWQVRSAGPGMGGTNDGFHFLYQPCFSNAALTVHLSRQTSADPGAKAGIMFRESLSASARNVMIALTADDRLLFQSRSAAGTLGQTTVVPGFSAPCSLRLVRSNITFTAYASANGSTWTQVGSVNVAGFEPLAYAGLAVTGNTNASNRLEDTNFNQAVCFNLALNSSVSISTVPNQAAAEGTPTPPIPFTVGAAGGNPLTITARSDNPNLLTAQNIIISGIGANRTITLTPSPGATGTCTVTLTASDGINTASTQFSLSVFPRSGSAPGQVLLEDNFNDYAGGNLPGTPFHGDGFASGGGWAGIDSSFGVNVADAATVSFPGLASPLFDAGGGTVTVKGDGSNLEGIPDLSVAGPFAGAGLLDSASGTIGGGSVTGTLYLRFLIRAHFNTGNGAYGGFHLSRGDDSTGVMIGNSLPAWAFSIWSPGTSTSADLNNSGGSYLFVDTNVHLIVARIRYNANAADDLTVWLDPNMAGNESSQNSSTTYIGTVSGDFSFNRLLLRGGYSGKQFDYGALCLGTSWSAVVPSAPQAETPVPAIEGVSPFTGSGIGFCFSGAPGQNYSILASTNLASPVTDWAVMRTGTFGFDPVTFEYPIQSQDRHRFFRISMP